MAPRRVDCSRNRRLPGFTLIELLVIMGIIALLLGLLLPALAKARKETWKTVSLNNIRQINIAGLTYEADNKGRLPITCTYQRGIAPSVAYPRPNPSCTWQFGGKNCDESWTRQTIGNDELDVEAADRPLNPYLYSSLTIYAPDPPFQLPANDPTRKTLELPIFKDPSDRVCYQQSHDYLDNFPFTVPRSAYDDTGTSYHWVPILMRETDEFYASRGYPDWRSRSIEMASSKSRAGGENCPTRFVWITDQIGTTISFNLNLDFRLMNSYGDRNKSIMAFLDGHARYLPVRPRGPSIPGNGDTGRSNLDYQTVFDELRPL